MGKGSLFNKWCWENWISTCKRINLDPYLTPYTKINSKWIKDLNVRTKPLRRKQKESFMILDLETISWIWLQKHRQPKKKDKLDYIKIKTFVHQRTQSTECKGKHRNGENIYKSISDNGQISKIYKELLQNKTNNLILKCAKGLLPCYIWESKMGHQQL